MTAAFAIAVARIAAFAGIGIAAFAGIGIATAAALLAAAIAVTAAIALAAVLTVLTILATAPAARRLGFSYLRQVRLRFAPARALARAIAARRSAGPDPDRAAARANAGGLPGADQRSRRIAAR
ncbi:MAG: hypothetical protein ACREE7_00885 [Dongiaceae bacterium]